MDSAKRWAESQPFCSSSSSTWATCSGDSACGASLRVSSTRECSRAARYFNARLWGARGGRREAGGPESGGSGLVIGHRGGLATVHGRRQQRHVQRNADLVFDFACQFGVLTQELAGVVLALTNLLATVGVPGARLLDDLGSDAQVDDLTFAADAFTVQDVELGCFERRRDLVLDDLDLGFVADDLVALLDGADATDVQTHRGVELQRIAARGGFRTAEHHTDLHADLVDEDDHAVGLLDVGGELAQGLAHQAGLQTGQ